MVGSQGHDSRTACDTMAGKGSNGQFLGVEILVVGNSPTLLGAKMFRTVVADVASGV